MNEKNEAPGAIDELALQNVLRKRHCKDWPNVMLQLTKRIQAVNQTWSEVISKLMRIPGFRLSWYCDHEKDSLVLEIKIHHETETHEFTALQLQQAQQYVEVLIMDKVDHSELIAKHSQ